MKSRYLLAVDPSLTASGWALFCLKQGTPKAIGQVSPAGTKEFLAVRYDQLQNSVKEIVVRLKLGAGDFLVCEGPAPLVLNPQSAIKVEGVRGIFESVARSCGMTVPGRVNPRTVQSEILGMRGPQLERRTVKDIAKRAAIQLFEKEIRLLLGIKIDARLPKVSQDILDALLIGAVAVPRVQLAIKSRSPVESLFTSKHSRRQPGRGSRSSGWTERELQQRFNQR